VGVNLKNHEYRKKSVGCDFHGRKGDELLFKRIPSDQKSLFRPPEFRNIKTLSLKLGLFGVIMNDKNIHHCGGGNPVRKGGALTPPSIRS
jgi:hypothetical protein